MKNILQQNKELIAERCKVFRNSAPKGGTLLTNFNNNSWIEFTPPGTDVVIGMEHAHPDLRSYTTEIPRGIFNLIIYWQGGELAEFYINNKLEHTFSSGDDTLFLFNYDTTNIFQMGYKKDPEPPVSGTEGAFPFYSFGTNFTYQLDNGGDITQGNLTSDTQMGVDLVPGFRIRFTAESHNFHMFYFGVKNVRSDGGDPKFSAYVNNQMVEPVLNQWYTAGVDFPDVGNFNTLVAEYIILE